MGGVNNINECEVFLKNMFNDENILGIKNKFLRYLVGFIIRKSRIKTMKANYMQIGGKSPLTQIQTNLCNKLNAMQKEMYFDFISTYVPPFAKDVLKKYNFTTNDEIILLPLYPHHSKTTVLSSINDFKKEISKQQIQPKILVADVFYNHSNYNKILINKIKSQQKTDVLIVSAHSLPVSIIKKGDLYQKHINAHFEIIKNELKNNFKEIKLAYQSKLGPVKWLEPSLKEELEKIKEQSVLILPISFCIDCSETVFELDKEYRKEHKGTYIVTSCPNDGDDFCNFLIQYAKNPQMSLV